MEVLLLGTGGPSGWPQPGCPCASCSTATSAGTSRAPACALVDDVLLLDFPPLMHGASDLARVELVLLTGTREQPERWLQAAAGTRVLTVLGPQEALSPRGEGNTTAGHELRALQHGSALAWDVLGPDGKRLLYAPGTGPLHLTGEAGSGYDLVLAGLPGLASLIAQLRRHGLVAPTTDIRALGYDHHAALPDVLQHHLAAWGVHDIQDGETVPVEQRRAARPASGRTLVLGGVRSGKSALAEQLVAAHPDVTYVATGGSRDEDAEWQQRIAAHRSRRPGTWTTVETTDLVACIRGATGALLIDCLGTWLTAALDRHGVWDGARVTPVEAEVRELLAAWRDATVPLVAVSNEVGSGVVPATSSGRLFRDLLGQLNAQVAAESETVLLTVAGVPLPLRVRAPA